MKYVTTEKTSKVILQGVKIDYGGDLLEMVGIKMVTRQTLEDTSEILMRIS